MSVPVLLACLALGLGALLEAAVYGHRAGLGLVAFYVASLLVVALLLRRLERRPSPWVSMLWISAAMFALAVARFDAHVVHAWGPSLFAATLVVAVFWSFAPSLPLAAFSRPVPAGLLHALACSVTAFVPILGALRTPDQSHVTLRVLAGLALGLPFMVVFGALFMASDGAFGQVVEGILTSLSPDLAFSGLRITLFTCLILGYLALIALHRPEPPRALQPGRPGDTLILSVILAQVNLLFLAFLVLQARYLFGGDEMLAGTGWTHADYARRGFFELLAVATGSLGLVAGVFRLVHHHPSPAWPLGLATCLVVQTGGVALSAARRLAMYMDAYGLTVARFYAAAGLVVICLLLGLVVVAVARRLPLDWLASRGAATVLVSLALISQLDVEGLVVATHLERPAAEKSADLAYLGSLSADAVPGLVACARDSRGALRDGARQALLAMQARLVPAEPLPWGAFVLSRRRAARMLEGLELPPAQAAGAEKDARPGGGPASDGVLSSEAPCPPCSMLPRRSSLPRDAASSSS